MKIIEAINRLDAIKPNTYTQAEKVRWLSELDGTVKVNLMDTHGGEGRAFDGYDEADVTRELLIPAPYDGIYIHWLSAQIDFANGETDKYTNSMKMYNSLYADFERYYVRTHGSRNYRLKFF